MPDSPASPNITGLQAMFQPRAVAVLGASDDPTKVGGRPIRYLREAGFGGAILPINARRDRVQGVAAYPSIADVTGEVDLAIVALPASLAVDAVRECADKGVRAVIVFSAGFAEIGEAGCAAQTRMADTARASGMRILGPNCLGAINLRLGVIGTFTSGVEGGLARAGRIGFVSQSGALGSHCFAAFRERGLGFSLWVTTGNECDIELADCLAYLAQDPDTDVIAAYLEGARNGAKLRAAFELARERQKPVIVLKAGVSRVGAAAVTSHTAALAGTDAVYDAVFRAHGVVRAHSIAELLEYAYGCSAKRYPRGNRIGLATVSGGVGVMMADKAAALGLDVAPMPTAAQQRMKQRWEPAAVSNPVDTTAQVASDHALLREFLEQMLEQGNYDVVVLFLAHTGLVKATSDRLREQLTELSRRYPQRLILVSALCTPAIRADYEAAGFFVFEDPSMAVQVAAQLTRLGREFARPRAAAPAAGSVRLPAQALSEPAAKRLLAQAGVPVAPERIVHSASEAAAAATALGAPVVLKIVSRDIAHKSDIGGVCLNVASPQAAADAYEQMLLRVKQRRPQARLEGVSVARMIHGGIETLIGVQRDPVFGPIVAFGIGGIFVEALDDVTLRPAPFDAEEAQAMIREIKGYPLLAGSRGRPAADLGALAEALATVSRLAWDNRDRLESLDINPFIVLPEGQGAAAVDALIVPATGAPPDSEVANA
jgi:acetate---CoA ligase (ADP-forming)